MTKLKLNLGGLKLKSASENQEKAKQTRAKNEANTIAKAAILIGAGKTTKASKADYDDKKKPKKKPKKQTKDGDKGTKKTTSLDKVKSETLPIISAVHDLNEEQAGTVFDTLITDGVKPDEVKQHFVEEYQFKTFKAENQICALSGAAALEMTPQELRGVDPFIAGINNELRTVSKSAESTHIPQEYNTARKTEDEATAARIDENLKLSTLGATTHADDFPTITQKAEDGTESTHTDYGHGLSSTDRLDLGF